MTTIALTADLDVDLDGARPLRAAAALAVASGARLVTVHATTGSEGGFVSPNIRARLSRWGRAIEHVPMIHACCDDVTDTVLDALQRISPELVVAGTHGRSGWLQLFSSSVAEGIARNTSVPTLVVPRGGRDLVGPRGAIDLRRLLVPAGDVPELTPAPRRRPKHRVTDVGARETSRNARSATGARSGGHDACDRRPQEVPSCSSDSSTTPSRPPIPICSRTRRPTRP